MPASAVSASVGNNEYSVPRILKHYIEEARKDLDLSDLNVPGIDEFSVGMHNVNVTHSYDIKNIKGNTHRTGQGIRCVWKIPPEESLP